MGKSSKRKVNASGGKARKAASVRDSGVRKGPAAGAEDRTGHRSEDRLLAAFDRQFRTVFEATADGIIVADSETRQFHTANLAFSRMSGYSPQEIRHLAVQDFHPPDAVPFVMQQFERLVRREITVARDIVVRRKDGSTFYADISCHLLTVAGRPCVMGFFRDVTERKVVEQALSESEEKYRTLVESAGETIATVNRNGAFLFMNKTAAARLGRAPDDYIGKTMWDLFPRAIADRQAGSVRKVIDTGKGMNIIAPTQVQGQPRWYNTTIEPIRDAAGTITAALVVGRDIHELHQARQALDEYREKMCRAEQLASVGALSATIAHELTQPLTVSRLALQEAMTELDATGRPEKVMESLRECLEGVCDATSRVERFRNFTRWSPREAPGDVWLQDVVKRTVRLLEGKAQERRVSLSMRGLSVLPAVHANAKDMEQMCFALMENAIQAADGAKPRKLVISGRRADDRVMLQFEDTCGGIAPEHLDRIFEPFFTTKPPGEGTGLGLCIVRRVVTQANGSIHVENHPGEGATFCVTLPVQE